MAKLTQDMIRVISREAQRHFNVNEKDALEFAKRLVDELNNLDEDYLE